VRDTRKHIEIQGEWYVPQVDIYQVQIATGDARRDGRAPSHDGECVWLFWSRNEWIIEDNAGVMSSSWTGDPDLPNWLNDEIDTYRGRTDGGQFTGCGSQALELMLNAEWLKDYAE